MTTKEQSDEVVEEFTKQTGIWNRKLAEEHAKPPSPGRDKNIKDYEWVLEQHEKLLKRYKERQLEQMM